MIEPITGKAWVFGDDIDTDALAPGHYMKGSLEDMASHCLETVDPEFASEVSPGDILVAGENFGIGSSREQAVQVLVHLGIKALVAKSYGGIFFRNALNFGLVAVVSADVERIRPGDEISIDTTAGELINKSRDEIYHFEKFPPKLLHMIEDGGLVPHLKKLRAAL